MYELLAQILKFLLIGLIYYFLYNFLKLMVLDLYEEGKSPDETGYCLRCEDGREFPIRRVTTIGRAKDSDIVIDDPYLSSKHAMIYRRGRRLIIQDLKSTNGTYINGRRIKKPMALKEKDVITMGSRKFTFLRREDRGLERGSNL
ncbi:FHA domain-containing protein [Caldanaerovirga acetigignens]|uniref:FHA domain-containing protein n=1 Tax=Caldanaerovirga acetigignens TaxID=447595 RepID=A0A1M7J012_9FIRM|nr:FHA domain-containing protein [Caldanaerovirga acetigignens]SHM46369.1 FHA domain-containing protein [Caldanaerovirga acetigignens]